MKRPTIRATMGIVGFIAAVLLITFAFFRDNLILAFVFCASALSLALSFANLRRITSDERSSQPRQK